METAPPHPARRRPATLLLLTLSAVLAAAGVTAIVAARENLAAKRAAASHKPVTVTAAGGAPVTAPPPVSPGGAHAPNEGIILKLAASPAEAIITIDNGAPMAVPLELRVPRDNTPHTIRVEAPGHVTKTETLSFANDVTAIVALERVTSTSGQGRRPANAPEPPPSAAPAAGPVAAAPSSQPAPSTSSVRERPSGKPPKYERLNTKLDQADPWKE